MQTGAGDAATKRHWKRTWKVVLPSVVLGVMGYGLTIPILTPYLVQSFTACDTGNDDCDGNRSQATTMKMFSDVTKAILSLVFSPVLGQLSDRIGRKPVTIATVFACNIAPFLSLVLFKKTCVPYLIVSAMSGIFSASPMFAPPLFPYIADLYAPEERAAANGLVFMGAGISIALSPLFTILGNIGGYSPHRCFWFALGLGVLNVAWCTFVLPESLPRLALYALAQQRRAGVAGQDAEGLPLPQPQLRRARSILEGSRAAGGGAVVGGGGLSIRASWRESAALIKSSRVFYLIVIVNFMISLPENGLVEVALMYFDDMLGVEKKEAADDNSTVLVVVGVVVVLVALCIKCLVERFSEVSVLFWGTVMSTLHLVGWTLLAWVPYLWVGIVTEVLAGLGFVSYPVLLSMGQAVLDEESQGVGTGAIFAAKAATSIIGPLFFGLTYANLREGHHLFGRNFPQFPFLFGVLVFLYALFVIRWRLRPLLQYASEGAERPELEKPLMPPHRLSRVVEEEGEEDEEQEEEVLAVARPQHSAPLVLRTALLGGKA